MDDIDIYPVGLLRDLKHRRVRQGIRYVLRYVRQRQWRAARNSFNGYLAEPREMPPGCWRCGHGWTRRRALRDFRRHVARNALAGDGQP